MLTEFRQPQQLLIELLSIWLLHKNTAYLHAYEMNRWWAAEDGDITSKHYLVIINEYWALCRNTVVGYSEQLSLTIVLILLIHNVQQLKIFNVSLAFAGWIQWWRTITTPIFKYRRRESSFLQSQWRLPHSYR